MQTVRTIFTSDYRIKGSKFLGYFAPCNSIEQKNSVLDDIKSEHPTATHHCYAFRLNPHQPKEFSQDDGEPGGPAGVPILNQLKSADIMNAVIVVVRYYGGTKLGKAGLIEAYGYTAEKCIESAVLKKMIPIYLFEIEYDYQHQGLIDQIKSETNLIEIESTYLERVTLTCGLSARQKIKGEKKLKSIDHLLYKLEDKGESYYIEK